MFWKFGGDKFQVYTHINNQERTLVVKGNPSIFSWLLEVLMDYRKTKKKMGRSGHAIVHLNKRAMVLS